MSSLSGAGIYTTQRWFRNNQVIVIDEQGGGDFITLTDFFNTADGVSHYFVMIAPGNYVEADIPIKNNVTLWGIGSNGVTIGAASTGTATFQKFDAGALENFHIYNCKLNYCTQAPSRMFFLPDGASTGASRCTINNCSCQNIGTANGQNTDNIAILSCRMTGNSAGAIAGSLLNGSSDTIASSGIIHTGSTTGFDLHSAVFIGSITRFINSEIWNSRFVNSASTGAFPDTSTMTLSGGPTLSIQDNFAPSLFPFWLRMTYWDTVNFPPSSETAPIVSGGFIATITNANIVSFRFNEVPSRRESPHMDVIPHIVKGEVSQSASLTEWWDSIENDIAKVTADGQLFSSGIGQPRRTSAITTTATAVDFHIRMDTSGGPLTLNLPDTSTAITGKIYRAYNIGSNDLTVDGFGAETINGSTTVIIPPGAIGFLIENGSGWDMSLSHDSDISSSVVTKSGTIASASFTGETATVSFSTNMPDTSYSIQLTAQTALTDTQVLCTYESKATTGFTIRISSSANTPDVDWVATTHSNP